MGRKKRKVLLETDNDDTDAAVPIEDEKPTATKEVEKAPEEEEKATDSPAAAKSGYSLSTHAGEIAPPDIYVSDGSESDDDIKILLQGSRSGLMRRGMGHNPMMHQQQHRQWTRAATEEGGGGKEGGDDDEKLDPAQREARDAHEAAMKARLEESLENVGRDPLIFSRKTAFDIEIEKIAEKQWQRHDPGDFFNYELNEEGWIEYSQQQLQIRQELIDAKRQKRPPDPNIVPIQPRTEKKAVEVSAPQGDEESGAVSGPVGPSAEEAKADEDKKATAKERMKEEQEAATEFPDVPMGEGGAWGAGAAPGSVLARLIAKQTVEEETIPPTPGADDHQHQTTPSPQHHHQQQQNHYGGHHGGGRGGGFRLSGRGGYDSHYTGGRGGGHRGGRGGRGHWHDDRNEFYESRKRPRDDWHGSSNRR